LVSGAASLDTRSLGKLGGIAVAYFLVTTLIASGIGGDPGFHHQTRGGSWSPEHQRAGAGEHQQQQGDHRLLLGPGE
ncbi:hypothetical protein KUCAC02_024378, partial [Chaenocephalus aceratus]